jgi:hypothetical protein
MIGFIIFYLVSVHLVVGMLLSLLVLSQRALGERFFRFNGTISLALLVLAQLAYSVYVRGEAALSSRERVLYWQTHIDGATPWLWGVAALLIGYLVGLPFQKYLISRMLLAAAALSGGFSLTILSSDLVNRAIPSLVGAFLFPLDSILSALALGSVVICMILGHWYLVDPGMPVRHLKVIAGLFIGVLIARVLLGSYTSVLIWKELSSSEADFLSNVMLVNMLFIGQRILFGLILPLALSWMIWQTVKIRSTQSATGILYVAVVFILFGEFLSRYILVSIGYPL